MMQQVGYERDTHVEYVRTGERISEEITGKKSVWRSDNGAECSVEQVALEYYAKKGFKG